MKKKLGFSLVLSLILIVSLCSPVLGYIGDNGDSGNGDHGDDGGGNGGYGDSHGGSHGNGDTSPGEPDEPGEPHEPYEPYEPGEGGAFVGDPGYIKNPEGISVVDEYGEPVWGEPLIDESGNPITGPNGDPLYYIDGKVLEIQSGQTKIIRSTLSGGDTSPGEPDEPGEPSEPHEPSEPGEPGEPGEGVIFAGDPVFIKNPEGTPLIDEYGNPILGEPLIDENGNPITGSNGNPMYYIGGIAVEIRSGQTKISLVDLFIDISVPNEDGTIRDKGSTFWGDPVFLKNPEGIFIVDDLGDPVEGFPLTDENGMPIIGPNGNPMYSIGLAAVEILSGQTKIGLVDFLMDIPIPNEDGTIRDKGTTFWNDPVYILNPEGVSVVDDFGDPVEGFPLTDENGMPIIGPNGDPLYYIGGDTVVEIRSGLTTISLLDLYRGDTIPVEDGTSSSGGRRFREPPPQVEVPPGLSERKLNNLQRNGKEGYLIYSRKPKGTSVEVIEISELQRQALETITQYFNETGKGKWPLSDAVNEVLYKAKEVV
ncbi:hypothetical protein ACFLWT_00685 [Chloroflexota bacterium]